MGNKFSIIEVCADQQVTITKENCTIAINSGHVERFGSTGRGELETDTDIAGYGVLIAFTFSAAVVLSYGVFLTGIRIYDHYWGDDGTDTRDNIFVSGNTADRFHGAFDGVIIGIGDSQLLTMIAYGAAFIQDSRCNISTYHHDLLIYTVLTGISTTLLGMTLVRLNDFDDDSDDDGEMLLTGIIRRILLGIILVGLSLYGLVPANRLTRVPKPDQDSIAVLPLFCFNDASLNPLGNFTSDERSHLFGEGMSNSPIAQVVVLGFMWFYVVFLKYFGHLTVQQDQKAQNKRVENGKTRSRCTCSWVEQWGDGFTSFVGKVVMFLLMFSLVVWNLTTVFKLREWAATSGWLQFEDGKNPEEDLKNFGQIAPLLALAAFGLTASDLSSKSIATPIARWVRDLTSVWVRNPKAWTADDDEHIPFASRRAQPQ